MRRSSALLLTKPASAGPPKADTTVGPLAEALDRTLAIDQLDLECLEIEHVVAERQHHDLAPTFRWLRSIFLWFLSVTTAPSSKSIS